jgi:phosphoribosylamine-glycine ligase
MEVKIFHAGTRQAQGGVEVARRDVLTVCALGTSLAECRLSADEVLGRISWADAPAPAWTGATG